MPPSPRPPAGPHSMRPCPAQAPLPCSTLGPPRPTPGAPLCAKGSSAFYSAGPPNFRGAGPSACHAVGRRVLRPALPPCAAGPPGPPRYCTAGPPRPGPCRRPPLLYYGPLPAPSRGRPSATVLRLPSRAAAPPAPPLLYFSPASANRRTAGPSPPCPCGGALSLTRRRPSLPYCL